MHPIQGLIILVLLLVLNAIVCAAEEAFANVSEAAVLHRAEEKERRAVTLNALLHKPHSYRNVIEIIVTASSVLVGMIYAFSLYGIIERWAVNLLGDDLAKPKVTATVLMAVATFILLYLIVLFGILLPKKIVRRIGENAAFTLAPVMMILYRLFSPVVFLLEKNSTFLLWVFGFGKKAEVVNVTEEEIISMVNEGHEQGVFEDDEVEMISNIIEFDEKTVKDVMTHRTRIVAVQADTSVEEALDFMLNESYSRFPLYGENLDDIVGVLHIKDVILQYRDPELRQKPLSEAAMQPYFVPDTQSLDDLFHEMQAKKIHMAIAIDEYGQTAGIVAMEDILEEIVGEIQDEYDEEEELIQENGEDCFIVSGEITLDELKEETGIEIREEDDEAFETLNGLMISLMEHIPQDGEEFETDYEGFHFQCLDIHDRMINQVKLTKNAVEESSEQEQEE